MPLSNKKIKALKNSASSKSVNQLSIEFGISEAEVLQILNEGKPINIQQSIDKNENLDSYSFIHTFLVIVLGLFIFWAPLWNGDSQHYDFANLMQEIFIQSSALFMVVIWLFDCAVKGKFEIKKNILYWPVLGILAWGYLTLLWTTNIPESLATLLQWTACSIIFFVLLQMVQSSLDVKIILFAILLTLVRLIYVGIDQFLDESSSTYNQVIRPSGTFGNKNMFCDYLTITLPVCFYFFMSDNVFTKIYERIIACVVFSAGAILIVFSFTRAGFVNFPFVFVLFLIAAYILYRKNGKQSFFTFDRNILLTVGFLIFLISIICLLNSEKSGFQWKDYQKRVSSIFLKTLPERDIKTMTTKVSDEELAPVSDSTTIRLITWVNTIAMIKDKPLQGYGLNNWQIHYADYRNAVLNDPTYQPGLILAQVHNDYLQIAVEIGLIGFFLFVWFVSLVFWQSYKIFKDEKSNFENKKISITIVLCMIGFGIACFFSFLMVKSIPTLLLYIFAAIVGSIFHQSKISVLPKNQYDIPKNIGLISLIIFLFLSIYVLIAEANRSKADLYFKMASDSITNQNYEQAISASNEVLKIAPYLKKTHFLLANAYSSTENYPKAEEHIELALKYYPNDLMGLFQAGTTYLKQLKNTIEKPNPDPNRIKYLEDKTLFWYNQAFEIRKDFGKAWNNLGFLYERRAYRYLEANNKAESEAAIKEAEKCFDNALRNDKNYSDAVLNKANILLNTKREKEAGELALKILDFLSKRYTTCDNRVNELNEKNFQKASGVYFEAMKNRLNATNEFLISGPKAVQIVRAYATITKEYNKLIPVLDEDEKIVQVQYKEQYIKCESAKSQYQNALSDSRNIRAGVTLELLEKSYKNELQILNKIETDAPIKLLRIKIDRADVHRLLGNNNLFLTLTQQIIQEADNLGQEEIATRARLMLNDFYLSNIDPNLKDKFPIIEDNFRKATYNKNSDILQFKALQEKRFIELKNGIK